MPSRNGPTPGRERRPRISEMLARAADAERTLADLALARGDWDTAASCEEGAALSGHMAALLEEDPPDGRGRAVRFFGQPADFSAGGLPR